ncbi:MAG: hypothetical protein AB7L90_00420 [Hyphomicrobiaceae bacterium]
MSCRLTKLFAVVILGSLLLQAAGSEARADTRCYGDWSEAAPIVVREKLRSALDVQDMARDELGGEAVRIVLCQGDGGFTYRLVLRRLDGRMGTFTVSAARKKGR